MDSAFVDRSGLGNVQRVAGLIELNAALIGEAEVRQYTVGVINADLLAVHLDHRRRTAGAAGKAGNFQCCLDIADQTVIVRGKVRNCRNTGIVEDVTCCAAFVGRLQLEGFRISEAADDLIDQKLGCNTKRHIGVGIFPCGGNTDGMIPHLIAVKQDQTNGLTSCSGHRIPNGTAGSTAAAIQGYVTVNGVTRGTGTIVTPGLNTVQRIVRIGNVTVPGKMPAQILDVCSSGSAASVGFIRNRKLRVQDSGVVAIVRKVEQHNVVLGTGGQHDTVIIGCHHERAFGRLLGLSRLRFLLALPFCGLRGRLCCIGRFRYLSGLRCLCSW